MLICIHCFIHSLSEYSSIPYDQVHIIVRLKDRNKPIFASYASDFGRQKGIKQINTLLYFISNVSNKISVLIFFLPFTGCVILLGHLALSEPQFCLL